MMYVLSVALLVYLPMKVNTIDYSSVSCSDVVCPDDNKAWSVRRREYDCPEGTSYHCIGIVNRGLCELCFPKFKIHKEHLGCPEIQWDNDTKTYYPLSEECPVNETGCPGKNEEYYSDEIYQFPRCIGNPNISRPVTPSTKDKDNKKTDTDLIVGIVIGTVLALVCLGTLLFCILRRRNDENAEPAVLDGIQNPRKAEPLLAEDGIQNPSEAKPLLAEYGIQNPREAETLLAEDIRFEEGLRKSYKRGWWILRCKVSRQDAQCKWYRDEGALEIQEDENIRINEEGRYRVLKIREISGLQGQFMIELQNRSKEEIFLDFEATEKKKTKVGERCSFVRMFDESRKPCEWYKDDKLIKSSERYLITEGSNESLLTIRSVQRHDETVFRSKIGEEIQFYTVLIEECNVTNGIQDDSVDVIGRELPEEDNPERTVPKSPEDDAIERTEPKCAEEDSIDRAEQEGCSLESIEQNLDEVDSLGRTESEFVTEDFQERTELKSLQENSQNRSEANIQQRNGFLHSAETHGRISYPSGETANRVASTSSDSSHLTVRKVQEQNKTLVGILNMVFDTRDWSSITESSEIIVTELKYLSLTICDDKTMEPLRAVMRKFTSDCKCHLEEIHKSHVTCLKTFELPGSTYDVKLKRHPSDLSLSLEILNIFLKEYVNDANDSVDNLKRKRQSFEGILMEIVKDAKTHQKSLDELSEVTMAIGKIVSSFDRICSVKREVNQAFRRLLQYFECRPPQKATDSTIISVINTVKDCSQPIVSQKERFQSDCDRWLRDLEEAYQRYNNFTEHQEARHENMDVHSKERLERRYHDL